ncbi:3-hydroxyacyl-CoA dehydrogenase family protein [Amycolatopsis sp. CA-230715]|uniref:3-hydroxyacyl-CoA dehydrogenase family protein n=1 Tax=Amycolatopsis sp. CA-230715 TaxID=2745196 RepID=UPI001C01AB7B|nr:3-hydroxyacyl-CoA dehydrogenase family protein [Amycolatopsis sp. CA-230715]QWF84515.1 Fatty acid oxidation complex subunit alpha [Amycolatopsis sp. CA-230715]
MGRAFSRIGVIGIGGVGSALTGVLAGSGAEVVAVELDAESARLAASRVERTLRRGPLSEDETTRALARIRYTDRLSSVRDCELVIEAVPEALHHKIALFREIDPSCGPDTVFATTTSGLPVTQIAAATSRMPSTVGLHFALNAAGEVGGTVELVCTPVTDSSVRTRVESLVHRLDRSPLVTTDRPGFTGAGLLLHYLNNAAAMVEDGYASATDVDTAMTLGCGLPIGPLAQLDLIGLDTAAASLTALADQTGDRSYTPAPILTRMARAGLLGRKAGRGFHDHTAAHTPAPAEQPLATAPAGSRVERIGIVGSGTMACGIAEVCARAGYPTVLVARTDVRAKAALSTVEQSLDARVARGKLTEEAHSAAMSLLTGAPEVSAIGDADFVLEAVAEDLSVKRAVFAALDAAAPARAVLATSTSSLPVVQCAGATGRPEQVLGMHFFNPAPAMRLVELAHTEHTSERAVATAGALATALGKRPVRCGDRAGFIVNALLFPFLNRAVRALDQHHRLDDVDALFTGAHGFPMGPFQLLDTIGLDISLAIQKRLHQAFGEPTLAPARRLRELVTAGYLGKKSGTGFRVH